MNFREWLHLREVEATSGKTGLYPLGYGGIGLYPLQYFMPIAADAYYYVSHDDRLLRHRTTNDHRAKKTHSRHKKI